MRIQSILFIAIFICSGCEEEIMPLSLKKAPYTGDELRIDGYYLSDQIYQDHNGIAIFYSDGFCIHVFTRIETPDTLEFIENDILLNKSLISRFMNTPTNIGVFQIDSELIKFETWEAGRDINTFSHYGVILNDTTFVLTKWIDNSIDKEHTENLTYRFKQFSPKPDSTNNFVK